MIFDPQIKPTFSSKVLFTSPSTLIISLFIFSGCGKIVLMKGPDGDIRECKGEYGFGGQIGAIMAANACVEEYEKVGYKRVE